MDDGLIASIRDKLKGEPTAELRRAHQSGDTSVWSPEALEAMRQLLEEREKGTDAAAGPASATLPLSGGGSGTTVGNFFLSTARVICVFGCLFAIGKTLYGLVMLKQVGGLINTSTEDSALLVVLILLDGFVLFCLSAALVVVFVRVSRLSEDRGARPS